MHVHEWADGAGTSRKSLAESMMLTCAVLTDLVTQWMLSAAFF